MPKVSVIIPAYNAERFLRQTIESVLAQTFRDFEIIVVDDGSKDETAEIAESFGAPVICRRKTNGGVSSARNLGIKEAKGEYVAFLDADDLWEPTKLEKQVARLDEQPQVGLCFAAVQRIDENDLPLNKIEAEDYPDFCEALLLYSCVVSGSCSSAMIRKKLTETAGKFNEDYTNYEDWDYWLRLSLLTEFSAIPEYLVKYRLVRESASFNPRNAERDVLRILNNLFSSADLPAKYAVLRNRSLSNNWLILSGEYLHSGGYADSLRCLWNALRIYPANAGYPLKLPIRWTKRLFADNI